MENIKVRVSNEAESKEVQELFFELGGRWASRGKAYNDMVNIGDYIFLTDCNMLNYGLGIGKEELTIPQLRDLVVLKRNDVNDAQYVDVDGFKIYIDSSNKVYFFEHRQFNNGQYHTWVESGINGHRPESLKDEFIANLKPIEKKEMKEFLVFHNDKWTLQLLDADTEENSYRVAVKFSWVNFAYKRKCNDELFFSEIELNVENLIFVWQRYTHPEELPFIDDEPKHGHYFKDVSDINTMDVYEVLKRFEVTDPCLQHIVKKALCAGQRGHKDFKKDLQDILDTAVRAVDINK